MITETPITDREFFDLPPIRGDGFLERHREIDREFWPGEHIWYQYLGLGDDPVLTCEVRVMWIVAVFTEYAVMEVQSRELVAGAPWCDEEPVFVLRPPRGACHLDYISIGDVLHATLRARVCGMPGTHDGDPWKDCLVLDVRSPNRPNFALPPPPHGVILGFMFNQCMDVPATPRREAGRLPGGAGADGRPAWLGERPWRPGSQRPTGWLYVYRLEDWDVDRGLTAAFVDDGVGNPARGPERPPWPLSVELVPPVYYGWSGPWMRMGNDAGTLTAVLHQYTPNAQHRAPEVPTGRYIYCRDLRPPSVAPLQATAHDVRDV
jgi:hypothetical protein